MIKANELRIGNHTREGVIKCFYESGVHIGMGRCFKFNELQPIPLTEEWLLKFGFVITVDPENVHYKKVVNNDFNESFVINRKVGYEVFYIGHKDCNDYLHFTTQIKHVHQLQNLYFALTNEELKIKEDEKV